MKAINKEEVQYAIELIEQAQDILLQATINTEHERHFRAYGCYGIEQALGNGNSYNASLYDLLD